MASVVVTHNYDAQNNHLTFGEKPSTALWQTIKKVYKNITVEPVILDVTAYVILSFCIL